MNKKSIDDKVLFAGEEFFFPPPEDGPEDAEEEFAAESDPTHMFVTSDHHFGSWKHNPCPWRGLVFTKAEEDELIAKWNSVVKKGDMVIYVGDFCDGGVADLMEYCELLNGSILLVKGNHDTLPDEVYAAAFKSVSEVLVIEELNLMFRHCP